VNLSDAFTFQEKERQNSEADVCEKDRQDQDAEEHEEGLEMKRTGHVKPSSHDADDGAAIDAAAQVDRPSTETMEALPPPDATSASEPRFEEPPKTAPVGYDAQSQLKCHRDDV
jgi:hypothetical protein